MNKELFREEIIYSVGDSNLEENSYEMIKEVDFYFIILDMITSSLWKLPKVHLKIYFMGKIEVFWK